MEPHLLGTSRIEMSAKSSFYATLAVLVLAPICWLVVSLFWTYHLLLPFLAGIAGAFGAENAARKNESIIYGAVSAAASIGALYSVLVCMVSTFRAGTIVPIELLLFNTLLGAAIAMSWGAMIGPLLARIDFDFRNRCRRPSTDHQWIVSTFSGAIAGALAAFCATNVITGSLLLTIYLFPVWCFGACTGVLGGLMGRRTELGALFWGSISGFFPMFVYLGAMRLAGIEFERFIR